MHVLEPERLRKQVIAEIRRDFINAPVGEFPSIPAIMRRKGLIAADGTASGPVNEEEIRVIATDENWRGQRAEALQLSVDLIPVEVELSSIVRGVQLRQMLARLNDLSIRAITQYHRQGEVTSLDGTRNLSCPKPETLVMGVIAEQRLTEALERQINSCSRLLDGVRPSLSPNMQEHLLRIEKMNYLELVTEI